ncbi:MAG: hypothetical protein KAJ51_14935, partial [Thermoplasmata archaeon]|nr:hypothetical protein [Thermoplasmata archaeon]
GIGGAFGNAVEPDSGAYGLEFQVTSDMIQAIDAGADAVVSYNWRYQDRYLGNGEEVWIRTHIRNGSDDLDLGFELDGDSREREVYWSDNPPNTDVNDVFIQDFSEFLQRTGSMYFDIGGKVKSWDENYKGGIFHFDNFYLRINQPPDVRFIGEPGTNFGASVGYCDKLNFDDYGDIIIGAPHYDSPNGVDSGAIFGFFDNLKTGRVHYAKNAEYATYGERAGDNFGWSLSEAVSVDSDEFAEVATSAINYDITGDTNVGRIYLLSITRVPRIRMVYPLGGEVLNETVAINATVIDPDNNIDNNFGVRFFYSTDLDTWTTIGEDKSPTGLDNIYEQSWDTTSLPDGSNYYLKAWVRDLDLNSGENITSAVTVDNTHPPQMIIQSPTLGETIEGIVEIQTVVRDSNLDLIGGGINTTRGINFYFSKDKTTWELLGSVQTGTQDEYSEFLETLKYPDGEYWIKVNATDWDGFEVEEIINVTIDNPGRAPSITLLDPVGKDELKGLIMVRATAFDFDGDINTSGVTFYIMDDASDNKVWQAIGNEPTPEINSTGGHIYSIFWDTTTVSDGWYMLKAYVMDNDSLSNESEVSEFKVHNEEVNPPFIKLITPLGGEMVKETQMITARVRDLEDNIDSHGVDYYYSDDRDQWRWIGSTATPRVADEEFFDFLWQTDTVPDGEYWLNVTVSDDTPLKSWDVSDEPIFIHN